MSDARQRILAQAQAEAEPTDLASTSLSPTQRRIVEGALERAAEHEAWERLRTQARNEATDQPSRPAPISAPGGGLDPHGPPTRPNHYDYRTWVMWLARQPG